tara:strand:- start:210 stop:2258 length:2049 start_codon:yes stop_codon:yes gene_type:complete
MADYPTADEYVKRVKKLIEGLMKGELSSEEFQEEFKKILSQDEIRKNPDNLVGFIEKLYSYMTELMNTRFSDADEEALKEFQEVLEKLKKTATDLRVNKLMRDADEQEILHVGNWNPSDKEKKNLWNDKKYGPGHKKLSSDTQKKVMEFLKKFMLWDDNFKIENPHKYGGLRIEKGETRQEIFKRLEKNMMRVPLPNIYLPFRRINRRKAIKKQLKMGDPDKILIILVLVIIEIEQGKKNISPVLRNFSKLTLHDTKGSSQVELFYKKYNEKKDYGHATMLQACMQYLTRPMSSKQKTLLRERSGIDTHWISEFTWDYFEAYEKMHGDVEYFSGEYIPRPMKDGRFEWHGKKYLENIIQKLNEEENNVVEELVKCIKKGYIQFNFVYFISLDKNLQNRLIEELGKVWEKKSGKISDEEHQSVGLFLKSFREKYDDHVVDFIEKWADEDGKKKIKRAVIPSGDAFNEIEHLLRWKNKEWYFTIDESETVEFKSNFYMPPPKIYEEYKITVKKFKKKHGDKKEFSQSEDNFTITKEKNHEIDMMKEICAFLNHKGGKLFFGVNDETGLVHGLERDKESKYKGLSEKKFRDVYVETIRQVIRKHFSDDEDIQIKPIELERNKKFIIIIEVAESSYHDIQLSRRWSSNEGYSKTKCFVYRDNTASEWECDEKKYVRNLLRKKKVND